jgi:hypothetical protein
MDVFKQRPEPSNKHEQTEPQILASEHPVQNTPQESSGDPTQTAPQSPQPVLSSISPTVQTEPVTNKAAQSARKSKGSDSKAGAFSRNNVLHFMTKGANWLLSLVCTGIVSILLGFNQPVTDIPVLDFIEHNKLTSLVILCICVFVALLGLVLLHFFDRRFSPLDARFRTMGLVTAVSTLSFLLCFSLLLITLLHPSWCPSSLCQPPTVIAKVVTTTQGAHDNNLDVFFIGFQSTSYVIPGDPQKPDFIPDGRNYHSIGAVLLGVPQSSSSYTIAIGLHSLNQGRFNILIDKVVLLVRKVSPVPIPLGVYSPVSLETFSATNQSRFVYRGQQAQQIIPDTFSNIPLPRVELATGESDQIDAAIESRLPVDMQFQVQVTYHIATEQQRFTLTVPQIFEAIFSKASNWHKYQLDLSKNTFVPAPAGGK